MCDAIDHRIGYYVITKTYPTLCDPMDYSLPGSSVHGISRQEWEWVAIPFSRGSSWPRDRTQVSCTAGRFFTVWATRGAKYFEKYLVRVKYSFLLHK